MYFEARKTSVRPWSQRLACAALAASIGLSSTPAHAAWHAQPPPQDDTSPVVTGLLIGGVALAGVALVLLLVHAAGKKKPSGAAAPGESRVVRGRGGTPYVPKKPAHGTPRGVSPTASAGGHRPALHAVLTMRQPEPWRPLPVARHRGGPFSGQRWHLLLGIGKASQARYQCAQSDRRHSHLAVTVGVRGTF